MFVAKSHVTIKKFPSDWTINYIAYSRQNFQKVNLKIVWKLRVNSFVFRKINEFFIWTKKSFPDYIFSLLLSYREVFKILIESYFWNVWIFVRLQHFKTIWNTFSGCLSRSVESATEVISLALDSVSHALKGVESDYNDRSLFINVPLRVADTQIKKSTFSYYQVKWRILLVLKVWLKVKKIKYLYVIIITNFLSKIFSVCFVTSYSKDHRQDRLVSKHRTPLWWSLKCKQGKSKRKKKKEEGKMRVRSNDRSSVTKKT